MVHGDGGGSEATVITWASVSHAHPIPRAVWYCFDDGRVVYEAKFLDIDEQGRVRWGLFDRVRAEPLTVRHTLMACKNYADMLLRSEKDGER